MWRAGGRLSQPGLDLWGVRANRTKMQGTALTALEPLVFPRISTEIGLVLAAAVDGMLSQPSPAPWELNVGLEDPDLFTGCVLSL